jgi:hypothetical protein
MKYIIYAIIIAITLFLSRSYIAGFLLNLFGKVKKKEVYNLPVNKGAVFAPTGTVRTFLVAIELEENGDGTAKINIVNVAKKKPSAIIEEL